MYNSLLPDEIRLLRLDANPSSSDIGYLEMVPLDKAPLYYALSHSWGSQTQNAAVNIGGKVLTVSSDLATGIRRLQELAAEDSTLDPPAKYVWIDSL